MTSVLSGLDRIGAGDAVALVRGRRVGLLAHAASVDARLRSALSVLETAGAEVVALFGPEHGFAGAAQDMVGVRGESTTGRPVYSLYGDAVDDLWPKDAWLGGLDAVVIDLQDVGARFYTYVWTAALMLRTAARLGVETIVLDRPNPIGGTAVEGAPQREGYTSFVGWYPVPVRHGMTIGELCHYVAAKEGLDERALHVVTMRGWRRSMLWADTDLPWVMPSPNMPTTDTAQVYPGGCLIEGTTLSEGRGTTRPFELFGAPGLDARSIVETVRLEGATLRPLNFQPTFQKHAGKRCEGVQVHVTDAKRFRPYGAYRRLLAALLAQRSPDARWRTETYEFVDDRPAIDLLTGGSEFREGVDAGADVADLDSSDQAAVRAFRDAVVPYLFYPH